MAIKYDKRNYRKHSDRNKELIKKSLEECGAGRSIVIDNEDNIIAGNGIYEQAQHFCMKSRGIKKQEASMVTSAIRGVFEDNALRQEFMALIS